MATWIVATPESYGQCGSSFTAAVNFNTAQSPRSVVTGDVNGDGQLDLVVADWGSNKVSVLMGNRDGTFVAGSTPSAGTGPVYAAIGDLNGDLVVANYNSAGRQLFLRRLQQQRRR